MNENYAPILKLLDHIRNTKLPLTDLAKAERSELLSYARRNLFGEMERVLLRYAELSELTDESSVNLCTELDTLLRLTIRYTKDPNDTFVLTRQDIHRIIEEIWNDWGIPDFDAVFKAKDSLTAKLSFLIQEFPMDTYRNVWADLSIAKRLAEVTERTTTTP